MNATAFILGTAVALGYYFYTVRKERARHRQQQGREEANAPSQPKGEDNPYRQSEWSS